MRHGPLPRRRGLPDDRCQRVRPGRGVQHPGALELHLGHGDARPLLGGLAGGERGGDGAAVAGVLPPGPVEHHLGLRHPGAQAERAPARDQLGGDAEHRVVLAPGPLERDLGPVGDRVPRHQDPDVHQRGGDTAAAGADEAARHLDPALQLRRAGLAARGGPRPVAPGGALLAAGLRDARHRERLVGDGRAVAPRRRHLPLADAPRGRHDARLQRPGPLQHRLGLRALRPGGACGDVAGHRRRDGPEAGRARRRARRRPAPQRCSVQRVGEPRPQGHPRRVRRHRARAVQQGDGGPRGHGERAGPGTCAGRGRAVPEDHHRAQHHTGRAEAHAGAAAGPRHAGGLRGHSRRAAHDAGTLAAGGARQGGPHGRHDAAQDDVRLGAHRGGYHPSQGGPRERHCHAGGGEIRALRRRAPPRQRRRVPGGEQGGRQAAPRRRGRGHPQPERQ
mmetsp:Transcript_33609/g.94403  ORF Transcript_33609/g.94403 Transcript_33609/m.94403 type:complete len:448 (+) Transcript_33609:638-1981(+)